MQFLIAALTAVYCSLLTFFLVMLYPRLKCWFYAFKKQEHLENPTKSKLAVIIPARDESLAIGALLDSLLAQTYPREFFDVHVIVASPDDPTISMTKDRGMNVMVVENQTCKSDALDAYFQSVLAEDKDRYEAYILIDADCALEDNFLEEMNNALVSGADIICSKKLVKNYYFGTRKQLPLSACCNGTIWTLLDGMGNKYKSAKGYPCFTVGTGLMLRKNVIIEKGGWPYKATLTEDCELMHEAALDHRKFFYYEHAKLYMEEADTLSMTNKRRRRWLTGVIDCERRYRKAESKNCSFGERYYASALNNFCGYIGTSAVFFAIMAILTAVLALLSDPLWVACAILAGVSIAIIYLSFLIMTAFAMLCDRKYIILPVHRKIALLFGNPIFYMAYIFIIGRAILFPGKRTWEVIERVDFSQN